MCLEAKMVVKTITIDLEAYETLGPESRTAGALLRHVAGLQVSHELLGGSGVVVSGRSDPTD
jgi:alanine dehydrogenase